MPLIYDVVGGQPVFDEITRVFLAVVVDDPVLAPIYAHADLDALAHHLSAFLAQYWGGPRRYAAERGDPRLSVRHRHVRITARERDAYLAAMDSALAAVDLPDQARQAIRAHLVTTAQSLTSDRP